MLYAPDDFVKQQLEFLVNDLGWWIIPCLPREKRPTRAHKHWDRPPTVDLLLLFRDQVKFRQRKLGEPQLEINWGVHVLKSGLLVADYDQHSPDKDGMASKAALEAIHGPAPITPQDTRNHWYYSLPAGAEHLGTVTNCWPGIDLKLGRSIVIVPPGIHKSGATIDWMPGLKPLVDLPLAPAPHYMLDAAEASKLKPVAYSMPVSSAPPPPPSPRARSSTLTLTERARLYLATVPPAVEGSGGHAHTRNTVLKVWKLFPLSIPETLDALRDWNQSCSPPWSERDLEVFLEGAERLPGERGVGLDDDRERPATIDGIAFDPAIVAERIPVAPPPDFSDIVEDQVHRIINDQEAENERRIAAEASNATRIDAPKKCPRSFRRSYDRQTDSMFVIYEHACNSRDCPVCGPAINKKWIGHMTQMIMKEPVEATFHVRTDAEPVAGRSKISAKLTNQGADYIWVRGLAILATAAFDQSREITREEAIQAITDMMNAIPAEKHVRGTPAIISTSKGWERKERTRIPTHKPIGTFAGRPQTSLIETCVEAEGERCETKLRPSADILSSIEVKLKIDPDELAEVGRWRLLRRFHERLQHRLNGHDPGIFSATVFDLPVNASGKLDLSMSG